MSDAVSAFINALLRKKQAEPAPDPTEDPNYKPWEDPVFAQASTPETMPADLKAQEPMTAYTPGPPSIDEQVAEMERIRKGMAPFGKLLNPD